MGSGLIYAVLILLWAIYFIPRWLRRHDQLNESRSVERFDQAMRILSRRDPVPDQRYVVMPPRPGEPARSPRGRTAVPVPPAQSRRPSRPAASERDGRRATALAVRRRRVLAVLLLLTAGLAAATLVAPVPWWAPVALLALTLADLGHVRLQRRRRAALLRDREAIRRRSDSRLRRHDSADRIAAARGVLAEQRAAAEAARVEQEWAAHESARRAAGRSVGTGDGAGWQPTPVPLPTYVTAPKAPRSSRPIDLTHPGKWSEQQAAAVGAGQVFDQTMEGSGYAPAEPPALAPPPAAAGRATASDAAREAAVDELDAILEGRRAVND